MTRTLQKMLSHVLCAGALASCLFAASPASAQVYGEYAPPPEYIATATPVYFEGRPAYWYNGRWCFRDARGWGYYNAEPAFLRDYRGRHEPVRQFYGRGGGGYRRR